MRDKTILCHYSAGRSSVGEYKATRYNNAQCMSRPVQADTVQQIIGVESSKSIKTQHHAMERRKKRGIIRDSSIPCRIQFQHSTISALPIFKLGVKFYSTVTRFSIYAVFLQPRILARGLLTRFQRDGNSTILPCLASLCDVRSLRLIFVRLSVRYLCVFNETVAWTYNGCVF